LALRVGRPVQTTAERLAEFRQHSDRLIVDTDSIADHKTRALTQAITSYVLSCSYSETPATPRDAEQQLETLLKCLQLFDEFEAYPSSTPTLFVWNCYARNAVRQVSMAVLNKHFDVNLTSWRLTEKEFN